jgi:hypothetical protein
MVWCAFRLTQASSFYENPAELNITGFRKRKMLPTAARSGRIAVMGGKREWRGKCAMRLLG